MSLNPSKSATEYSENYSGLQQYSLSPNDKQTAADTSGALSDDNQQNVMFNIPERYHQVAQSTKSKESASSWVSDSSLQGNITRKITKELGAIVILLRDIEETTRPVISILIYSWLILQTITLATYSEYKWGFVGGWVMRGFAFLWTLSFDLLPYEGLMAFSIISFIVSIATLLMFLYCFKAFGNGSKYLEKAKKVTRFLCTLHVMLGVPMMYCYGRFLHCDYSSGTLSGFQKSTLCWSSLNIGMIVISVIGALTTLFTSIMSAMIMVDINPLSRGVLIPFSPFFSTMWITSNIAFAFVQQVIPPSLYYIPPILLSLKNVGLCVLLCYRLPFMRRVENSVIFGVLVGSICWSIVSLTSFSVMTHVSNLDTETVGLIFMGIALAIFILGFICGFISLEVVSRLMQTFVKKNIEANILDGELFLERGIKYMDYFIIWAMKDYSNSDYAQMLIKTASSSKIDLSFQDRVIAVVYTYYLIENSEANSILLLKKTEEHIDTANFIDRMNLLIRKKEITCTNMSEIGQYLEKVLQKQENILLLKKSFWKTLLSEESSEKAIESNISSITMEIESCNEILQNLVSGKREKSVFRTYARFLEQVLQEKESSEEFYDRANQIEENETRKRKLSISQQKANRVHPLKEARNLALYERRKSVEQQLEDFAELESASMYRDEKINPLEKIREIYRIAIKKENKNWFFTVFFISLAVIPILLVLIAQLSNVFIANENSQLSVMITSAILPITPYSILIDYRFLMKEYELRGTVDKTRFNTARNRLTDYYSKLQDLIVTIQSKSFTDNMKVELLENGMEVFVPSLTPEGNYTNHLKNMTYQEITHQLTSILEIINNYTINEFVSTARYEFLFLWKNGMNIMDAMEAFCDKMTAENFISIHSKQVTIIGIISAVLAFLTFYSLFYILTLLFDLRQINKIIKLFKLLPKDEIGKIFHELENKTSTLKNLNRQSSLFAANRMVIYLVITAILLTYASLSMILFEAVYSNTYNMYAISKVQTGTEITHSLTKTMFSSLQIMFDGNDEQYLQYSKTDLYEFSKLFSVFAQYNGFRFGDSESGFNDLVGLTDAIDSMVLKSTNNSCGNYSLPNVPINTMDCLSLDEMIDALSFLLTKQTEDIYNKKYSDQVLLDNYYSNLELYSRARKRSWNVMLKAIDYYTAKVNERIISGVACVIPVLIIVAMFYANKYMTRAQKERNILMLMFCNVAPDILENIDPVKNYIFNRSFKHKSKQSIDNDGRAEVRAICDAAVDGLIICTGVGLIEMFNTSSESMFGYKSTDIMGLSVTTLFDKESRDKVDGILTKLRSSSESIGETFEASCLRKNERKFTARVTLSVSLVNISKENKKTVISCFIKDITQEIKHNNLINEEKMKSEALLLNILPEPVANRLKAGETNIYENFADVTCYFSDIVGFTVMSSKLEPDQVVSMLNEIVNSFDVLCDHYELEKIKTIGDAYFCAGGLHNCMQSDHPEKVLRFAIGSVGAIQEYNDRHNCSVNIRCGLHTGSVVAGVLGQRKFAYDLWGDAVNTASRMESTGLPGRIQISRATYERVHDLFEFDMREIEVKGKGKMKTYLLKEKHHTFNNNEQQSLDPVSNSSQSSLTTSPSKKTLSPVRPTLKKGSNGNFASVSNLFAKKKEE